MKRKYKILITCLTVLLTAVLLTGTMLLLLARSSKVQTALVQLVTKQLSDKIGTPMRISGLDYEFPNRLLATGIYVEDEQQDTLLFVDTLRANFRLSGFFHDQIELNRAELLHVYANAYTVAGTDGRMNYDYLLDMLPKKEKSSSGDGMKQQIEVRNVRLDDVRLHYDDWRVNNLQAEMSLNKFQRDSLDAEINHLSFTEGGGLVVEELQTHVLLTPERAEIGSLCLRMPHTTITLDGYVRHAHTDMDMEHAEQDSTKRANMFAHLFELRSLTTSEANLNISQADITLRDIGSIVPAVRNINGTLHFTTHVRGRIDSLLAEHLSLDYKSYPILRGDVSVVGLPNLHKSYVHGNLDDLRVDRPLLQDFLSDIQNKPYLLPKFLSNLGVMHYKGAIDGRLDSLMLNGVLSSRVGNLITRGWMSTDSTFSTTQFRGRLSTSRIQLGTLLAQKDLGNIGFRLEIDGAVGTELPFEANLDATLQQFQYRNYTYRDISLNGLYHDREFTGQVQSNDENCNFCFSGLLDLTQELPIANFELMLNHLRLGQLHLSDKYADADLSGILTINGSGNSLDNMNGYVYIDSLRIDRTDKSLFMRELRVLAETGEDEPTNLKVYSDFLNANISGHYKYSQLPTAVERIVAKYVPRMLSLKTREKLKLTEPDNELIYYLYFKNLNEVCDVLDLPVKLSKMPTFKGFLNERTEQFAFQAAIPQVVVGNNIIDDITLNFDNRGEQINLMAYLYKHAGQTIAEKRLGDVELFLKTYARQDSLYLNLDFNNKDSIVHAGSLRTATHFTQYAGKMLADLHILPSEMNLAGSIWQIDDSHIIYAAADTSLQVNNFRVGNNEHFIYADGLASRRLTDSVRVELRDIVIDYLLDYTNVKKSITFGGAVSGWAKAFGVLSTPAFEADVRMDSASINDVMMGDVHAIAWWDRLDKTVGLWGALVEAGDTVATVDGLVEPLDKRWGINIYPDSANLAFINGWTEGIIDDIQGRGYGWVHVFGEGKQTWVEGEAMAKDASLGIGYIGTRYHLTDTVILDLDRIRFENIDLTDDDGNPLRLNGVLEHKNFKDFHYSIDLQTPKAQVMNLPANTKDMFYGKVYAAADVHIRGTEQECQVFADARTMPNTSFSLSLATASSARDNSNYITFVDHRVLSTDADAPKVKKPKTKVIIKLQIEATPDAEVNIILDPRNDDKLQGRGQGNVQLTYDVNTDDIKLFGNYQLQSGKFYFTFENLLRKEFTLRQGSMVTFSGDPMNLMIDASAHYSTNASLRDLFGSDYSQLSSGRNSIPVNCILYLKGNLTNPLLSFGIELPQADESVQSQVRSIINTDEMMMREILYLLVFNRFYTPEYLQTNTTTGLNETYSILSSTITGQINNWLRRLTDNFTIGFNVRTDGSGDESSQEYETQFQYQPNNRLLINGNFGYRYNDISNQPIFGNLDVEYMLTPSGMWRAKAYTHMVDKYSLRNSHTVQGVGLMFKYDFDSKSQNSKRKTQRDTILRNDSIFMADTIKVIKE